MANVEAVLRQVKQNEPESIRRWMEWLRIPSISTDPAYAKETRRAGEWAGEQLRAAGFRVEVRETTSGSKPGHPIVMAWSEGAATATSAFGRA